MHDSCTCWKSMLAWIECLMAHSSDFAPLQPTARLPSLADLFCCFTQFLPWVPGVFFLVCGWMHRCRPKADVNRGEAVTQTGNCAGSSKLIAIFRKITTFFIYTCFDVAQVRHILQTCLTKKNCGLFKNWIRTSQETFGTASYRQNLLFLHECSPLARDTPLDVWLGRLPSHALFWSHLV